MYGYTYDLQTGGLLLNDSTPPFSKEPRPVYSRELDILFFDKYYKYQKQDELPYMWAEANCYWYRGQMVARAKGGTLYTAPELEVVLGDDEKPVLPVGVSLTPVDIPTMVNKNRVLLKVIEQLSVKRIFDVYKRYKKKKVDCFHVAFSGGKDSIVLLELVKKALPNNSFIVVFGDTGMEFPDTYDVIDKIENQCRTDEIEFYRASSHLTPEESWRIFGPPSRVLRWCCSVHKSAPQTLKLREVLGKNEFIGMDFVGVRAYESTTRADYDYENYGKKQKGQYSHNAILDWSSAEIWLYIFAHNLILNETYKRGNSRAGCLFCPMGGGKGDSFQMICYSEKIQKFIDIIKSLNIRDKNNSIALESYVANGGWNARKNGRDLSISIQHYKEVVKNGNLQIIITNPQSNYHEWLKTVGEIPFDYKIEKNKEDLIITINDYILKNPYDIKLFKQVFKKVANCIGCRVCESNCPSGCISFKNGLKITGCIQCKQCHEMADGCLIYHSLKVSQGGERTMRSINSFANHAPKPDWVQDFFKKGTGYWADNTLGINQVPMFKKFLRECGLIDKKDELTQTFAKMKTIGWENEGLWGIILSNFAYNAQCEWYIRNLEINRTYLRSNVSEMLISVGVSKDDATSIINAFKRFCELPLGTKLNFGTVTMKGKQIETLTRGKSTLEDNRVVLYSLYKFAEVCENYYQFNLSRLLDHTVESIGISPTQIFGFDRDDMERFLNGLSVKYPDFINFTSTHDLDKITLREDKTSQDILTLF
jgi:phosphoadenosine phosphosulfate reductase